jgi:AcrR family transcriptional regulator
MQDPTDDPRDVESEAPAPDEQSGSSGGLPEFPLDDPVTDLAPTAKLILEAARRLLHRGGIEALRWDAVAAEAGRNKSAIKYYFGNTKGLLLALVDSLDYEECLAFAEETRGTTGEERLDRYVAGQRRMTADTESFTLFYELYPHVARDDELRPRVAALYAWYYEMNIEWLGMRERVTDENRDGYLALGALMTATVDGLALQAALDPPGFDFDKAFAALRFFLDHALEPYLESLETK